MICFHGFHRFDFAVGQEPQELDEGQLALGVVDLAAEQGRPGAVLPGFVKQPEGVVRCPSLFSITRGFPPSMIATQEFVVPKSIPIIFAILLKLR